MVRILFLVMATNTLMFTFIGSAVSYDNLVNLLAVLSVASLVGFVATEKPSQLLLFLLWNFLGTLTKTTFLPLTLVLMALYLFDRRSKLREDALSVFKLVSAGSHRARLLVFVTLVALLGNFWLYGSNLVRFGKPVPGCSDVLDLEQCMENRIFARNWVVNGYRTDRLTFNQAMAETWKINHPGDRDHAVRLLQNERAYRQSRPKPLPRWDYIQMVWIQAMKPTIFGIQAHLSTVDQDVAVGRNRKWLDLLGGGRDLLLPYPDRLRQLQVLREQPRALSRGAGPLPFSGSNSHTVDRRVVTAEGIPEDYASGDCSSGLRRIHAWRLTLFHQACQSQLVRDTIT
jgi:hypothetical protein